MLLFTRGNQVGFVRVAELKVGPVFCNAPKDVILTQAQADYSASVFLYGLSPATQELYVFRTSNLVAVPYATSCEIESKFKLSSDLVKDLE